MQAYEHNSTATYYFKLIFDILIFVIFDVLTIDDTNNDIILYQLSIGHLLIADKSWMSNDDL